MDFDYEHYKADEIRHHERILQSLPVPIPRERLKPHPPATTPTPACRTPPIKPRTDLLPRPQHTRAVPQCPPRSQPANKREEGCSLGVAPPGCQFRAHTLLWFEQTQAPRLRSQEGALPAWFHGFTSRRESEELLMDQRLGCFLLRLSESKIGFVLSYRAADRCRHFIIDQLAGGQYVIAGEESVHPSLDSLIQHYRQNPVGPFDETLTTVCDKAGKQAGWEGVRVSAWRLSEGEAAQPSPPTHPHAETPQYAVLKKQLKKSKSLSLSAPGAESLDTALDSAGRCRENEIPDFIPPLPTPLLLLPDQTHTPPAGEPQGLHPGHVARSDAPYARVNKQRQPAAAPAGPTDTPEDKYSELLAPHTYEETGHLAAQSSQCSSVYSQPDLPIPFYAVGRNVPQPDQDSARSDQSLYSEVDLQVSRARTGGSHSATPPLPIPSIPSFSQTGRPPLCVGSPSSPGFTPQPLPPRQSAPPCTERRPWDPEEVVYEQIREGLPARPPLPRRY
ncbi:SH2 domain-containing protein 2A isoform X2 [Acipenser oxyrinchus oxyrinchus]|uniref:SH2 domain-containing protein 2A isoform X2 n=1 Tax=Acipenser oxyrinchus oxyrinchus TaxID=40147 RepID=A0AAD8CQM9_ACIOX|nr:SH2 domain-containing protein 2A isoform X2 [Acipenser oxyrinchus oxyrinchus]